MLKIFLLSFLLYFSINNKVIKISFYEEEKSNIEDFIFNNKLITNLKIGTPIQIIPAIITFETYYFLISNIEKNRKYNKIDSSTFSEISDLSYITFFDKIFEGIYSTEIIDFNNNNITKINYFLIEKHNNRLNINSAVIGLHLKYFDTKEIETNLLFQLKKKEKINLNIFSFNFNNNNKGELIIGKIPHEFNKSFDINSYKYTIIEDIKNDYCYGISFENIFFGNSSENQNFKAEFSIDINGFIGSNKYKKYVNENFFDFYFKLNKCFIKNFTYNYNNYIQYFCNKEIDIKNKILNINFYHKILNFTFEIDDEILWKEIDNKYYFLVIFNEKENNFWVFGRPFLKKYFIVFDVERKLLGFYLNNNIFDNNNKFYYYSNILIFILTLFIIFLLFFIKKNIKNNKKIRANELKENIDYTINDEDFYKKLNNINIK